MLWFFLCPIIARALGRFQANFIAKFTRTVARGDMPSRTHPNTACHESSNSPRTSEAEAHSVASLLPCQAVLRVSAAEMTPTYQDLLPPQWQARLWQEQ